jgi:hypothetical protein
MAGVASVARAGNASRNRRRGDRIGNFATQNNWTDAGLIGRFTNRNLIRRDGGVLRAASLNRLPPGLDRAQDRVDEMLDITRVETRILRGDAADKLGFDHRVVTPARL